MRYYDWRSIAAGAVGTTLILILTFPSLMSILSHFRAHTSKSELYQDRDGVATEGSTAAFTAKLPKTVLSIFTVLGLGTSIALAVIGTVNPGDGMILESWLNSVQWGLLLIQVIGVGIVRSPTEAYSLGTLATVSSVVLLVALLLQDELLQDRSVQGIFGSSAASFLRVAQVILPICTALAGVSIPRHPHLFLGGKPVDRLAAVSALSRYSFGWCTYLLRFAIDSKKLDLGDLPKMDHHTRSEDLTDMWKSKRHTRRLWMEVALAHKWPIIQQWSLTLCQAFGLFAPQFVLLHILRVLEKRQNGQDLGYEAVVWVIALFVFTIAASALESWLFWVSWADLAIPIRSQLAALIFQKAMRRKDVKGATKSRKRNAKAAPGIGEIPLPDPAGGDKPEVGDEDDTDPKGKQSTVNLIGVDAKRVSDFCSFNNYFPGCFFKLVISFAFLLSIIGWKSLLAGFAAMSLTIPINIFFSRRYAAAQDRLMKIRDVKMGVVTEALQGIRQIKFSALENNWYDKIGKVRDKELTEQWNVFAADTFLFFCWITNPIALAATSLAVYAYVWGELRPSVAFTAIGIFGNLEVTLAVIPDLTTDLIDAYVSMGRIERYLSSPEISPNTNYAPNISFEDASIAWPSDEQKEDGDEQYVLRGLNISFPEKELSVVSGKTGTGKSLLLASIIGEVDVLSGKINVPRAPDAFERHDHLATRDNWIIPSSVAFVAQIPWIENATIKDNILFGLPLDEYRYNKVIEVCALRKDLDMLTDGENTEIGANGINLSGGQRWRVTFARALYSRAGILILDDIFSAVDAHVGRFIFEKGLTGELGDGRTRILVTHHVALCKSKTKYIVELGNGTVEHSGMIQELKESGSLERIISHDDTQPEIIEDEDPTAVNSEDSENDNGNILKKVDSKKPTPKKFVVDEHREKGRVRNTIYKEYFKSAGAWPFVSILFLVFAMMQCLNTGRGWLLRLWTGTYHEAVSAHALTYSLQVHTLSPFSSAPKAPSISSGDSSVMYYLGIYVSLSITAAFLGTFRYFWMYTGSIHASKKLFNKLSYTILRTPLRWIDTVPLGRILNRFTADFAVVDARLAINIAFGINDLFRLLGVLAAGIFVSPYIIVLSLILLAISVHLAIFHLPGSREVKRLESNTKSPVFEQFGSALSGISTIRSFDKTSVYITRMFSKIDDHATTCWYLWGFNRWVGFRVQVVGAFYATIVATLIMVMPDIDAALAGFALAFALEYTSSVFWTIRHYTQMELDMNAAERIIEYSNLPTESLDGIVPPAAWPAEGRLEVNNLTVGYAPELPPVLQNLTFTIERNQRVGVVGRTGAGKSSLTLALFRFLEAREGSIHIDGLDISKIQLSELRGRLAIIPQDPVLFSGTVRTNLDAFEEHSDEELRDALVRVHLIPSPICTPKTPSSSDGNGNDHKNGNNDENIEHNKNAPLSLATPISEGGLNLSQGQRQLLCLARAIVSRPKIMVLDEATSAVDMGTDKLIQRSIREEFGDSTLVVIAHRLSTICDFDRILVLGEGRVLEWGTPKELLGIRDGVFRGMVLESGERSWVEGVILGADGGSQ
ncbi:hypothetical protein B7494_g7650 [Chlorociboria aeruginascens]|nr:hypothetical protein B7494_g7650 [Chlorociboria aeruginascens]